MQGGEIKAGLKPEVRRKKMQIFLAVLFIIGAICFIYGLYEPYRTDFKKETVTVKGLPEAFQGMKIGFISDTHADDDKALKLLDERMQLMKDEGMDILLLGGDYADSFAQAEKAFKIIKQYEPKGGIYAIGGNHDKHYNFKSLFKKYGFNDCTNKTFTLERDDQELHISGIADYITAFGDYDNLKEEGCTIMLTHNPKSIWAAPPDASSIAFAGHTHGGQVTVFGLFGLLESRPLPCFTSQWIEKEGYSTKALYSNGSGQEYDIRFFAIPQIHVVKIIGGNDGALPQTPQGG